MMENTQSYQLATFAEILDYKTSFKYFLKTECMRFLEKSGIKLGIKANKIYNKKHIQHAIHHSEINHGPKTVKISTRIRKYLYLNNNEDSIYQSL